MDISFIEFDAFGTIVRTGHCDDSVLAAQATSGITTAIEGQAQVGVHKIINLPSIGYAVSKIISDNLIHEDENLYYNDEELVFN